MTNLKNESVGELIMRAPSVFKIKLAMKAQNVHKELLPHKLPYFTKWYIFFWFHNDIDLYKKHILKKFFLQSYKEMQRASMTLDTNGDFILKRSFTISTNNKIIPLK